MQMKRSSVVALILAALVVGWLLPIPAPTAQEQGLPDDFTFASGEWVEQIERRVDRNAALLQAILSSMDSAATADFRQALRRLANQEAVPNGIQEQAQEVLERLEPQGRD